MGRQIVEVENDSKDGARRAETIRNDAEFSKKGSALACRLAGVGQATGRRFDVFEFVASVANQPDSSLMSLTKGKNKAMTMKPMMPPSTTIMIGSKRLTRVSTAASTSSS